MSDPAGLTEFEKSTQRRLLRIEKILDRLKFQAGSGSGPGGGKAIVYATFDSTNPPTEHELETIFGPPAGTGTNFLGLLNDAAAGTSEYLVTCDGTTYWYQALTKPIAGPALPGDRNSHLLATDTKLARTNNWLSGSPNWVDLTAITPSGQIVSACLYEFDQPNVAFVCTTNKVYLVTGCQGSPVWTEILDKSAFTLSYSGDPVTVDALDFVAAPTTANDRLWVGAWGHNSHITVIGMMGYMSVDVPGLSGALLATGLIGGASGVGIRGPGVRRIVPSRTIADRAFIASEYGDPGGGAAYYDMSYDGSSALLTNIERFFGAGPVGADLDVDVPSDGLTMYYLKAGWQVYQSTDAGATWNSVKTVTPAGSTLPGSYPTYARVMIDIARQDTDDALFCFAPGDLEGPSHFYRTVDGGANIDFVYDWGNAPGSGANSVKRWPDDALAVFFLGNDAPYYSPDMFGTAPQSKLGDWLTAIGAWPHTPSHWPVAIMPVPVAVS